MNKYVKLLNMLIIFTLVSGLFQLSVLPQRAQAADNERKTLDVNKTRNAPVIDGQLDESVWTIEQHLDRQVGDGPFKDSEFGMLWDNRYLYIAVKSDDDTLISNGSGYWFEQDGVNVFLDPTLHQSAPFAAEDMQVGLTYQPDTTTPKLQFGAALNNHSGKDERKILRAIRTTATGWSLEVAVPWDMLNFDPNLSKQLGIEIGTTDRYGDDTSQQRTSYWSAYNSSSFWNDTSGYGVITLVDDSPVSGTVNPVLLEDNFDSYEAGSIPPGWISDVSAGSNPMTVVKDTDGNGRMVFDGKATGKQGRIIAPVQWDDYTVEADVRFESVLNAQRWASVMLRVPSDGKVPYDQMAIRQNGSYEFAYRKSDGNWYSPTPIVGTWKALALNSYYTLKVRVFGNNVKEYIKAKNDASFTLLTDKTLSSEVFMEKGKIGLQADQSKVSFDNVKVTRVTADQLDITLPNTMEALSGAVSVSASINYSDGITEPAPSDKLHVYSSDENVIKIVGSQINPIKEGHATVKVVYADAEWSQEITVTPSTIGAKVVSLKHDSGYVLADAGEPLLLDTVAFQADYNDFTSATVRGGDVTWTSADPAVVIGQDSITVQQKGVYTLTAEKDGIATSLLVVAKNAGDSDYVLYEENFDAVADGTMPQGWSRKEGTTTNAAAVNGGAFEINALASPDNPSRVLLPDYLGMFGDYKIEADVTNLASNDAARWNSIMYRIQNDDYPYYQMAVRKDATASNGVEFAERTPGNAWNVMEKGPYAEAISPDKLYHYTVKVNGNRAQEWIGSQLMIDTDQAGAYAKGKIGLQANGSKMRVDNIRITLQQEPLPPYVKPSDRFVQVTEPDTQIVMAPTVVTEVTSLENLASYTGSTLPATVILHVNGDLKVMDPSGDNEIGTLDSVLGTIGTRMIPAFYVKDEQTVDRLIEFLNNKGVEDAFVISDNGELVKRARTAYPIIRGIVDFSADTTLSADQLMDIRRQTTVSLAKIAILPQSASTMDNVSYLQQRMISIWTKEAADSADKSLAMHSLITAGVNGIVTDSPNAAFEAYKVYSHLPTLIRKPYMIGHRGLPSQAPENTIESNLLAVQYGADFIENDMYLSKDGHIVILHDTDLSRTTNGTGSIENYTLAELKQLNANKPHPAGYPDVKIPTLDEQIDLAQAYDRMIMAEIKTSTSAAIEAYVSLIKEKNAESDIDTMSFDANQLKLMAQRMPEMPLGLLVNAGTVKKSDIKKSLRDALRLVQPVNASFNTGYDSELTKDFLEAAKHRGLIVSPWTYNNRNDFIHIFMSGPFGITTDYVDWAADWAASIQPEQDEYSLKPGETVPVSAIMATFKGDKSAIDPEIVLLDGQDTVDVNGKEITAKHTGKAHVLLRYTYTIDGAYSYDLYTQPILIHVESNNADLAGLTVSSGTLTPDFAPEATHYEAVVGYDVNTVEVTPTAGDANATIHVNGVPTVSGAVYDAELAYGANRVAVEVTAEDGTTTKEYVLSIIRQNAPGNDNGDEKSHNANLAGLAVSSGKITPDFAPDTTHYEAVVGYDVSTVEVTPTAGDANATIEVNGVPTVSGAVYDAELAYGANRVAVEVTAEDGTTTKEYVLSIIRQSVPDDEGDDEKSHNADLAGLAVSSGKITPDFAPDKVNYETVVGHNTSTVQITPTADDANATIHVNGVPTVSGAVYDAKLAYGTNRIAIEVMAEDGITTKEYVLKITRKHKPDKDNKPSAPSTETDTKTDTDTGTGQQSDTQDPGTGSSVVKDEDGLRVAAYTADEAAIQAAVHEAVSGSVTLALEAGEEVNKAVISLNPSALQALMSQQDVHTLVFQSDLGTFELPLKQIDIKAWASKLGVPQDQVQLTIQMVKDDKAAANAEHDGWHVKAAVEFQVMAATEDGSRTEISSFSQYVPRTIPLNGSIDERTLAALRVEKDASGNTVYSPVPFVMKGGSVVLYSRSNSTYILAERSATFSDLSGHWAKQEVERMAGKWMVQGMDADHFAPDREVTRAEFAALIVRTLGLTSSASASTAFRDVKSGDWFANAVGAAAANGLVSGYDDQTFRPYDNISRQEMAVMIYRAMQFAGYQEAADLTADSAFADEADIAPWAREATAKLASLHIVSGVTPDHFAPESTGTRAESAVMLSRMLRSLNFSH